MDTKNKTNAGKGDKRRPTQVSDKELKENWERTFGKKEDSNDKNVVRPS